MGSGPGSCSAACGGRRGFAFHNKDHAERLARHTGQLAGHSLRPAFIGLAMVVVGLVMMATIDMTAEPKTKDQLQAEFGYKSKQALDHHLQPLKAADLLRREIREDGVIVFEWSNLFRRLPKATIRSLLGGKK